MQKTDWERTAVALSHFGGDFTSLKLYKTGLPFYDALRLYGAIDLYIGLREDVSIADGGYHWILSGISRTQRFKRRDVYALKAVYNAKKPTPDELCNQLRAALQSGEMPDYQNHPTVVAPTDYRDRAMDPALQTGIRGLSAFHYASLNSTSSPACKAKIPLTDAVLAYAGLKRVETIGDMQFLPVFEGRLDLSKIVTPVRASLSLPNPLCAQVLMLLSLKTALWAEGYSDRLSAVAYKKSVRQDFNYSGIIQIKSTAIHCLDGEFCSHLFRTLRPMVIQAWKSDRAEKGLRQHLLSVAEWLMQPSPHNLSAMVTAQEILLKIEKPPLLISTKHVTEVFKLTHKDNDIGHDSIRALANCVHSAIYHLNRNDKEKTRDRWYNEVVALRNSPTSEAFRHRVLTLIEQGRSESSWIEPFDPKSLFDSMGDSRSSFERFRDCFRMYLILANAPKATVSDDNLHESEEKVDTEVRDEDGQ